MDCRIVIVSLVVDCCLLFLKFLIMITPIIITTNKKYHTHHFTSHHIITQHNTTQYIQETHKNIWTNLYTTGKALATYLLTYDIGWLFIVYIEAYSVIYVLSATN